MITRYRWYRVHVPKGGGGLVDIVASHPMAPEAEYGFRRIDEDMTGVPRFRFLWRTRLVVTRFDDEGAPLYEEIATVSFTDFAVISIEDHLFIRIENPGRSIRELLNALESIIGIGFVVKQLTFEKINPTELLLDIDAVTLVRLRIVGALVGRDIVARMEFVSKQGISIENIEPIRSMRYRIDSASYELVQGGLRGQLFYSANGTIKVSGQLAPRLVYVVEQNLKLFNSGK